MCCFWKSPTAFLLHFKRLPKTQTVELIGQSAGLQRLDRKCWVHERSEETGSDHCVGVSPEGRERGGKGTKWEMQRREERGLGRTAGKRQSEREKGWGCRWWKCFVHCVKCDHVLEPLRQLGKFPCPWLPAENTLRRHQGCRPFTLLINPSSAVQGQRMTLTRRGT